MLGPLHPSATRTQSRNRRQKRLTIFAAEADDLDKLLHQSNVVPVPRLQRRKRVSNVFKTAGYAEARLLAMRRLGRVSRLACAYPVSESGPSIYAQRRCRSVMLSPSAILAAARQRMGQTPLLLQSALQLDSPQKLRRLGLTCCLDGDTRSLVLFAGISPTDRRDRDIRRHGTLAFCDVVCCPFGTAFDVRMRRDAKHAGRRRAPGAALATELSDSAFFLLQSLADTHLRSHRRG